MAGGTRLELAVNIMFVCFRSVGVLLTMCSMGAFLQRKGVITKAVRKGMSEVSMRVCIPCLLFSGLLSCRQCGKRGVPPEEVPNCFKCETTYQRMSQSAILLIIPFIMVAVGLFLGTLTAKFAGMQEDFYRGCIAAVAFPNCTGMPIVLLSVIYDSTQQSGNYSLVSPLRYIPTFLVFYPMLQWGIGSWLFGVGKEEDHPHATEFERVKSLGENAAQIRRASREIFGMSDVAALTQTFNVNQVDMGTTPVNPVLELTALEARPSNGNIASGVSSLFAGTTHVTITAAEGFMQAGPKRHVLNEVKEFLQQVMQPPIVAICCAVAIGLTPFRGLLVDLEYQCGDAFISWVFQGIEKIGQAAVPINVLVLGATLADSNGIKALPLKAHAYIILSKMVLMPLIMCLIVETIRHRFMTKPSEEPLEAWNTLWLVAKTGSALPTANNINTLAQLGKQNTDSLASTIFMQYLCAPVLVPFWLTIFLDSSEL